MPYPLHISIIDDEPADQKRISDCLAKTGFECSIDAYSSGNAYLSSRSFYDFVLLDIELQNEDGIHLSSLIRQKAENIIYFTSSALRMQEAFAPSTIGFLLKQDTDEEITSALKRIFSSCMQKGVTLRSLQGETKIPPFRILKVTRLFQEKEVQILDLTLQDCLAKFPHLAQANKSELINLDQIRTMNKKELILTDGSSVHPSRIYFDELYQRFLEVL